MRNTSKLLSLVLRHKPENIDIKLDKNGWTDVSVLMTKLYEKKDILIDIDELTTIVRSDDKKRFSFSDDMLMIRASQGHSVDIDLKLASKRPPRILFHGTVDKAISSILKSGISKMKRHAVHLSEDLDTANIVGSRRGSSVIIEVQSGLMFIDGYKFQISDNGVWLVDSVPSKYLKIV